MALANVITHSFPGIVEIAPIRDTLVHTLLADKSGHQPRYQENQHPTDITQGIEWPNQPVLPDVGIFVSKKGRRAVIVVAAHYRALGKGKAGFYGKTFVVTVSVSARLADRV